MVKEIIPSDTTACKIFDVSEMIMVGNPPTIPPHGDPCFLDNISVHNHGELNSRETCRLLRPTKEILNLPSFKCLTNTTQQSMTRIVSQPSLIDKMNFHQNSLGSHQVIATQQQHVSSSLQMSDELNTPDIVGPTFEFTYDPMPICNSSTAATASDLMLDCWDNMNPIPINTADTHTPMSEMLGSLPLSQPAPQRPAQLTLTLHANCLSASSTPTLNVDTPNVVLDTPDVLQSFTSDGPFDLISYINNEHSTNTPLPDCPTLPRKNNITKVRGQKSATTSNREQRFIQEEPKIPMHIEFAFLNPVIKPDPESLDPKTEPELQYTEIKQEYFPEVSSTIPSPLQELSVTPSHVQGLSSRKRSSRLMSKESKSTQPQYYDSSESDEDSAPKRPRRNSSVMSNTSYGQSVGKSEYNDRDDSSSIAGSAAESRYKDLREKNNEASRRSRQNRRKKETETEKRASLLEAENRRLQSKHDALQKCVHQMREILLNNARGVNKNT